jgi:hypothetical protein
LITNPRTIIRICLIVALLVILAIESKRQSADSGICNGQNVILPFTDVAGNTFFCQIAEAYFTALTFGTTPSTYSPAANVTRDQMAAFITRTLDQSLLRGSRRAALNQWAIPPVVPLSAVTTLGGHPLSLQSDGADLWVSLTNNTVSRVRASDGRVLETWTDATNPQGVVVVRGRIFIAGTTFPGSLYRIDPKQPPGSVEVVSTALGDRPEGITTDGAFIWTANLADAGLQSSVSKINPDTGQTTNFTGFDGAYGILYDGANVWVTCSGNATLKRLNTDGSVAQSVVVGGGPAFLAFDGTNLWVPDIGADSVSVVRASTGLVVATLTGNGLSGPLSAAFDGQRILVTNEQGQSVSLWNSSDLTPLGTFSFEAPKFNPFGACSDGINFWIGDINGNRLARF